MSIELLELIDENKDYLLSNFKVTNKFIDIFMEHKPEEIKSSGSNVEDWIDEWYNLWPKGIKSGGYPVKSGVKGCLVKMKKFIKEYPNYNKDIIMKATNDYISYSRMNNYRFMQLAHYYIYKNSISTLASNCELIEEGGNDLEIDKFSKSLN